MSKQVINLGTDPNDKTGDSLRDGGAKINSNFDEVYDALPTNTPITPATKTKITYDAKGIITGGEDATTEDIAPSANKNYVTDAEKVVIGNTSGTNTGDQNLSGFGNLKSDGSVPMDTDNTSGYLDYWDDDITCGSTTVSLSVGKSYMFTGLGQPDVIRTVINAVNIPPSPVTTYTLDSPVLNYASYDTVLGLPYSPTEDQDISTKKFVEDSLLNAPYVTLTAGENLMFGDWCYLKSDGKMWKADASAEATAKGDIAMVTATTLADATGIFQRWGDYASGGLTVGAEYYLSETSGLVTTIPPTTTGAIVRLIGYATSATVFKINISETYIELS